MNKDTQKYSNENCPSIETVCAFHDGELSHDSPEARHIAGCESCRRIIQAYEIIESRLRRRLRVECPEALIERIKQGVRTKLEQPARHRPVPLFILRTAAAFLICSVVLLYGINSMRRARAVPADNRRPTLLTTENDSAGNLNRFPYYTGNDRSILPGAVMENTIPLRNFVGVNYGGEEEPVFEPDNSRRNYPEKPAEIADQVHQVWLCRDAAKADVEFHRILNSLRIPVINTDIKAEKDEFKGRVRLTRLQLVKLVRECKNAGFELVSPQSPQPEQKIFRGNAASIVNYQIDVLSQDKR